MINSNKEIKDEILNRCKDLNIDGVKSILNELVKETKIEFYNIKLELDPEYIKSVIVISKLGKYEISFKNIKSDYRGNRLKRILKK